MLTSYLRTRAAVNSPRIFSKYALLRSTYATTADSPPVTGTNRAEATQKRFWKTVGIEKRPEGLAVTLDRRGLKTPSGNALILPPQKLLVATLVANEWENQEKVLKAHSLPVTSLVSRAIDGLREKQTREEVHAALLKYFETDTICFHEESPKALVKLQEQHWKPLLSQIQNDLGVHIKIHNTIFPEDQPTETIERIKGILNSLDEWQLAALERVTYSTKSFLIALALIRGLINVEQASQAAHVEVNSQIEKWGEVEDSHDVDHHDIRRQLGSAACLAA